MVDTTMEFMSLPECEHRVLHSKHDYDISTYTWECTNPRAVVVMVHGLATWSAYDCLAPDEEKKRRKLRGSFVNDLTTAGFLVHAYDHPGHGQSSGLRSYVDSFDVLRDVLIEVCTEVKETYPEMPIILVGSSMGAATCVLASMADSNLADGIILVSPAVRTPKGLLGWYGGMLRALNQPLSAIIPRVKAIQLPMSDHETIREAFLSDPLTYKEPMRVRMGAEFLRIYHLFDKTERFTFKNLLVLSGMLDKIVDPEGMKSFFDRCEAKEKSLISYPNMGHSLLHEPGFEIVRTQIVEWISQRIDSPQT